MTEYELFSVFQGAKTCFWQRSSGTAEGKCAFPDHVTARKYKLGLAAGRDVADLQQAGPSAKDFCDWAPKQLAGSFPEATWQTAGSGPVPVSTSRWVFVSASWVMWI